MKKSLIVVLVIALLITPLYAAGSSYNGERVEGISILQDKMRTAMDELDSKEAQAYGDTTYKTLSRVDQKLDSAYYDKTLMTDYTKSKTMEMLGQLAITTAFAIGTAELTKQKSLVDETATGLKGSQDPQYQELGNMYQQLGVYMEEGNEVEAQGYAEQIKNYTSSNAPNIDSGYRPSEEENTLLSGLAGVLARSLGRIGNLLVTVGLNKLFQMLGFGALASNPLGLAISIVLQETVGAVAGSISNNGEIDWKPVENSAIGQSVDLADQGAKNVEGKIEKGVTETKPMDTGKVQDETSGTGKTLPK